MHADDPGDRRLRPRAGGPADAARGRDRQPLSRATRRCTRAPRGLQTTSSQSGLQLRRAALERALVRRLGRASGARTVRARVTTVAPKVTMAELRKKYPAYIIVDRGAFTLRFYKNLQLPEGLPDRRRHAGARDARRPLRHPEASRSTRPGTCRTRLGRQPRRQGHPARPAGPAQGALDGVQRRRRHPRHRPERVRLDRPRGLARLRAHAHPGRDRRSTTRRRSARRSSSPEPDALHHRLRAAAPARARRRARRPPASSG